jgi:hypothetical protein
MTGNTFLPDYDWYSVIVPAGKHTLSFEVVAYDEGSTADLTVRLWDQDLEPLPAGCTLCDFNGGVPGVELDPFGEYQSEGNEIVWIQVQEVLGRESPANWYVLTVHVEGS